MLRELCDKDFIANVYAINRSTKSAHQLTKQLVFRYSYRSRLKVYLHQLVINLFITARPVLCGKDQINNRLHGILDQLIKATTFDLKPA